MHVRVRAFTASASASAEPAPLSRLSGRLMVCSRFMVVLMAAAISASVISAIAPATAAACGLPPGAESCARGFLHAPSETRYTN